MSPKVPKYMEKTDKRRGEQDNLVNYSTGNLEEALVVKKRVHAFAKNLHGEDSDEAKEMYEWVTALESSLKTGTREKTKEESEQIEKGQKVGKVKFTSKDKQKCEVM